MDRFPFFGQLKAEYDQNQHSIMCVIVICFGLFSAAIVGSCVVPEEVRTIYFELVFVVSVCFSLCSLIYLQGPLRIFGLAFGLTIVSVLLCIKPGFFEFLLGSFRPGRLDLSVPHPFFDEVSTEWLESDQISYFNEDLKTLSVKQHNPIVDMIVFYFILFGSAFCIGAMCSFISYLTIKQTQLATSQLNGQNQN